MSAGELDALATLLKEYYEYSTSNERKREIEGMLGQFQRLPDSWRHCVAFLKESQDSYVQMFCLIVLDNTVIHRWRTLSVEHKGIFTQFVHELLYCKDKRYDSHFSFVRNKIAKVIIEIGRADWPHAYSDFLENILKMLEFDEYVAAGLLLLQTASDEFMLSESSAASADRCDELRRLMVADVPRMLHCLGSVLGALLRAYRSDSTRAPPSSPGETPPQNPNWFSVSPLTSNLQQLLAFDTSRCMHLDERGLLLSTAAFRCLSSLFTWVPPAAVHSSLLVHIFHYVSSCMNVVSAVNASYGASQCYCSCGQAIENASQFVEVSVNALGCLIELLSKSYTPPDFRDFLAQASAYTYVTLCRLCSLDWTAERDQLADRLFDNDVTVLFRDAEPLAVGANALDKSFSTDPHSLHYAAPHVANFGPPRNVTAAQTDPHVSLVQPSTELLRADESFLEEFIRYIRVLLGSHFRLLELDDVEDCRCSYVTIRDLLAAFYKFTLSQSPSRCNSAFANCMEVWRTVLDCIVNERPLNAKHAALRTSYLDMFAALANQLTMKMQFRFNESELSELNSDSRDDSSDCTSLNLSKPTEFHSFVSCCVETLAGITALMPAVTYAIVADLFTTHASNALELARYFVNVPLSPSRAYAAGDLNGYAISVRLELSSQSNLREMNHALQDLATFTQAIARLVPEQLCGTAEQFSLRFSDGEQVVTHLVNLTKLFAAKQVWNVKCLLQPGNIVNFQSKSLVTSLVAVHVQCLRALSTVCSAWLTQFQTLCMQAQNAQLLDSLNALFGVLLDECVAPSLAHDAPNNVALAAAQLLLAIVRCRPARLLENVGFRTLTERAAAVGSFARYPDAVLAPLYRAIVTTFTVSQPEYQLQTQSMLFDRFVVSLSAPLFQLADCCNELGREEAAVKAVRPRILHVLFVLNEIVSVAQGESNKVKQMAARSLDTTVQCALHLLTVLAESLELLDSLTNFVLNSIRAFRTAFRPELIDYAWSTFAALMDRSELVQAVADGASRRTDAAYAALNRFVELITFLVQDTAFRPRLAHVLRLALERVYPSISTHDAFLFVRPTFYAFVQDVLLSNWHFFFKQQFAFSLKTNADCDSDEIAEHREQLVSLLSILADGLVNNDPSVLRAALEALEAVHNKQQLYGRAIFRQLMLQRVAEVLLNRLLDRTYSALQEELSAALYNVARTVQLKQFCSALLPQFVSSPQCAALSDEHRLRLCSIFNSVYDETDLLTFTKLLARFSHDYRFFVQCNSAECERNPDCISGAFRLDCSAR